MTKVVSMSLLIYVENYKLELSGQSIIEMWPGRREGIVPNNFPNSDFLVND